MSSPRIVRLCAWWMVTWLTCSAALGQTAVISGELKRWHKVTLTVDGPNTAESATPNPFTAYRMTVTFSHPDSGLVYRVPGYFAADGNAAQTGATSGNKWVAHLSPDHPGVWNYAVSFRAGKDVAVDESPGVGSPVAAVDGLKGSFVIGASDKNGGDFRAHGRLTYVGEHYLRFAGSGEYFLKAGADAPENLLAYADFDGDFKTDGHKDNLLKTWAPHVQDWKPGDPTWQGTKGKGLIGAVNYLASKGMNAFSFLTLNIIGDDRNVFPYTAYDERYRMDVSRLAQWEIVFEYAQTIGLFLHFKTSEAENQMLLDGGEVGPQRKLYYRELIARFGHHLAMNWNIGEENGSWGSVKGQSSEQRRATAQYIYDTDPYHHHLVIHNGQWFDDLYGDQSKLTGASLQTSREDFSEVHTQTLKVYRQSEAAGKPWAVACDEPGDAQHALITDAEDPDHDNARKNALWGHFMAGGWGVEWYFGYNHPHSDLTCQDWRSRDKMWDQSRYALEFFRNYAIPFWAMRPNDAISPSGHWVLASPAEAKPVYAVLYARNGGECVIDLPSGTYAYGWVNPRTGAGLSGLLQPGTVVGEKGVNLPAPDAHDWVLLIGPKEKLKPVDRAAAAR